MQDDNSPCKGTIQYPRWRLLSAKEQFNMRRNNSRSKMTHKSPREQFNMRRDNLNMIVTMQHSTPQFNMLVGTGYWNGRRRSHPETGQTQAMARAESLRAKRWEKGYGDENGARRTNPEKLQKTLKVVSFKNLASIENQAKHINYGQKNIFIKKTFERRILPSWRQFWGWVKTSNINQEACIHFITILTNNHFAKQRLKLTCICKR